MKLKDHQAIILTIIISTIAYLFVYHTFIPLMIHENAHKISHEYFTGGKCNITMSRDVSYDDPFHEGYYTETSCDTNVYGIPFYITKVAGYGFELVLASILLVSPFSSLGGFWFSRLSKSFIHEIRYDNYDLFFVDHKISIFLGVLFFILFLLSFVIQYNWIKKLFSNE